jgi:ABC-type dipeptide/oligopeptide/nickel transport system permease subunit
MAVLTFVRQEPIACFFAALTLAMAVLAVFAPLVSPYGSTKIVADPLQGMSSSHILGTDEFGRDLFARVIFGARVSLAVGILATAAGTVVAFALGVVSAFAGAKADYAMQRLVDTVQAVPAVVLLLAIVVALGPSIWSIVLALSFRSGIVSSRVIRGAALSLREADFVGAAESVGASRLRVILVHVTPNVVPLGLVLASVSLSTNVIAEASISFLGFGLQPPEPTWGRMLSDGRTYMLSAPNLIVIPTVALGIVVLAANLMGDAVRDRLDPRLRK